MLDSSISLSLNTGNKTKSSDYDFKNSLSLGYEKLKEDCFDSLKSKVNQIDNFIKEFQINVFESFKKEWKSY